MFVLRNFLKRILNKEYFIKYSENNFIEKVPCRMFEDMSNEIPSPGSERKQETHAA